MLEAHQHFAPPTVFRFLDRIDCPIVHEDTLEGGFIVELRRWTHLDDGVVFGNEIALASFASPLISTPEKDHFVFGDLGQPRSISQFHKGFNVDAGPLVAGWPENIDPIYE